ncbi:hypothetical protein MJG53_004749 [Ovis ammon polii x Ovis aries]|uniref:Uncharacterized protein n=1 Tax=Ovis ammon polii x Ovis aries TaxID=2918886 RepID=A0ACB9VB17_9CETA|nr:hypothetical protein MJG53_004749 [Ovis ammon polii x Ovis aries]
MAGVNICIKCSMFIFNFVFWLCGAIILSVAISIRAGKIGQEIFTPGDANLSPFIAVNILIFVGAVIMILGFLGCCGAMKENQFMMILFFIGLLMILLLQVAAGILATARKSKAEQALNKTLLMNARLLSSTNENERVFQKAFSELQEELKCCGLVNGASDWGSNFRHYYKTCECPRESDSCIKYSGKTIYKQSCYASISHMFSKHLFIVTALAFGLAAIESKLKEGNLEILAWYVHRDQMADRCHLLLTKRTLIHPASISTSRKSSRSILYGEMLFSHHVYGFLHCKVVTLELSAAKLTHVKKSVRKKGTLRDNKVSNGLYYEDANYLIQLLFGWPPLKEVPHAPGHLGFSPACYFVIATVESDIHFSFSSFDLGTCCLLDMFYISPLALSALIALESYPHGDIACPTDVPSEFVSMKARELLQSIILSTAKSLAPASLSPFSVNIKSN